MTPPNAPDTPLPEAVERLIQGTWMAWNQNDLRDFARAVLHAAEPKPVPVLATIREMAEAWVVVKPWDGGSTWAVDLARNADLTRNECGKWLLRVLDEHEQAVKGEP